MSNPQRLSGRVVVVFKRINIANQMLFLVLAFCLMVDKRIFARISITPSIDAACNQAIPIKSAEFSPDGRSILVAKSDGEMEVWDATTRKTDKSYIVGSNYLTIVRGYTPDCTLLLTAGDDGTSHLWDAKTGASLAVLCTPMPVKE